MSRVPLRGSAAPGLRRAGGDVAVAGLAPVHSPLLPLDGAHLLLAVLLPLLPRDLDGVVLRHGRRRVACPAEETELRGAGGQPRGLGAAPGCGSGSQAGSGPAPRAHSSALPPNVTTGACTLQRRCKPSHICVPARHGLAQHCKPWHGHAAAAHTLLPCHPATANLHLVLQTLAQPHASPANPRTLVHQHNKPRHSHTPALQTHTHSCSSTANPRATTHQHCKPSLPAALTLQTLFLPAPLLQSLAQLHADTASPHPSAWAHRTPSHTRAGGAVRPCAPVLAAAGPGSWPRVTADPPEPACPPRRAAASGGPGNN